MRRRLLIPVLLLLPACGGGPTGPEGSIQGILNNATPNITLNGVAAQPGATVNVTVGTTVAYRVDYRNNSGQTLHTGLLLARDDGGENLITCGASGSGGDGGSFGMSSTISNNDSVYPRGRTIRVLLLGALGPGPTGPGQCLLGTPGGVANHAAVQAERLLLTLVVQ